MIFCEGFQATTPPLTTPIEGLGDAVQAVSAAFADSLKPTPPLDYTAWAVENVIFGNDSEFSGPYNPALFPFFKEPLECLQPSHAAREVVLKKSAQIGGTIVAQVFVGACADLDPGPFAYIHPSLDNGKRWVRTKWSPFVRMSKALRHAFQSDRSRDTTNTIFHKERKDSRGYILISGANSEASLSMFSVPRQVQDDLSKWENNGAGDSESQADSRSEAFPYAKIFKVSTPMIKGTCRITKAFERSDQRLFFVPCPQCGHEHDLNWENFRKSLQEGMDPAKAHFSCPECGGVIEHHHKRGMVSKGRWVAQNPGADTPGFYIWAAYSPLTDWSRIARKWLRAMGDPQAEQNFYNDTLGLAYEQKGEAPPWQAIQARADAEGYERKIIPPNAILLTCGVDVQGDRVKWHLKGFGPNLERYTIDYDVIEGHISEEGTRASLDRLLKKRWVNAFGRAIAIDMLAIDANYDTEDVLDWAKKHPDSRVIAVRGAKGDHAPPLMPVKFERKKGLKIRRRQKKFFNIGVSSLKTSLFKQLEKLKPGQRGFCGYPKEMGEDFFKQLCSERRVMKTLKTNYTVLEWQKLPNVRNEVLDTEIYAEAAARRLGWTELTDEQWDALRAERESTPQENQLDMLDASLSTASTKADVAPVKPVDVPEDEDQADDEEDDGDDNDDPLKGSKSVVSQLA